MKKFILGLLFVVAGIAAQAQVKDFLSVHAITRDTVVNTATVTLTSPRITGNLGIVAQCVVTKISGTVAGTIQLHGSLDGQNFKVISTPEGGNAEHTAENASSNYLFRYNGVTFPYYRISWTGTGTMSASFVAKILSR